MGTIARLAPAVFLSEMTILALHLGSYLPPLTPQTPTHRSAFEYLCDSLASTSDTTALRRLLQTLRRSDPLRAGSLSFNEVAPGQVIRSRRTVRLDRLKPGNYVVEVRVTAPDGSSQVRRRPIRLVRD